MRKNTSTRVIKYLTFEPIYSPFIILKKSQKQIQSLPNSHSNKMLYKILFVLLVTNAICDEIPLSEDAEPLPGAKLSKFYNCKEFEADNNYTGNICTFENYERRYDILPIGTAQIKEVDFKNSELFDVPHTLFKIFPKLTFVNMTNTLVKRLSNTSFLNADNLEWLFLDKNEIVKVPAHVFKGTPKLEYAYLRNNLIKVIDKNAFKDALNLKLVYLSGNNIESIDPETFSGLEKLSSISLARNKLKELNLRVFYKNPSISGLFLNNNFLDQLILQFRYNSLTSLNIDNNKIRELKLYADEDGFPDTSFSLTAQNNHLSSLHDISTKFQIDVLRVPNNSFNDFSSILSRSTITILDLSHNLFGPIFTNTFKNLTNLNELHLNDANVTNISLDAFKYMPNLWTLNIANNKLKINDVSMFESAKALKTLDISGNVIEKGLNVNEFKKVLKHLERLDLEVAHD